MEYTKKQIQAEADPFWKLDLVDSYTCQEWKPLFRNI
jgi:uncharacterized protein YciI